MIKNLNIENYKKNSIDYYKSFLLEKQEKKQYGIVYTPFNLVEKIINLIPNQEFKKLNNKWLDAGSGFGNFSLVIYDNLLKNNNNLPEIHNHIINDMLYFSELCSNHITYLNKLFGDIQLFNNFLTIDLEYNNYFDIIVGNPPYNYGTIKTPTNINIKKIDDGKTIWQQFIIKSLELLKDNGYLCMIVPAIWLKPDKAGIYKILTQYKIIKLHCFSNTETNKLFNYEAQTPTCFFLLKKTLSIDNNIDIYDQIYNIYIPYDLQLNYPIPMFNISILNKFLYYVKKYGYLKVYKSNTPSVFCNFSTDFSEFYSFRGISSCILTGKDKLVPELIECYSNIPTTDFGIPKIILAHKMYGFPYFDISGNFGVSSRDNYIIKDYTINELKNISLFLSTKIISYLYNSTSYRMKYLEKYIFNFIPDITKIESLNKLPSNIEEREKIICDFFNLSKIEREIIEKNFKNYKFFH